MNVYLVPETGRKVRIPQTPRHLPAAGEHVEDSPYWRRRVQQGDVSLGVPPYIAEAHASIDAVAKLLEQALAEAKANDSTQEAGAAALEAFGEASAPLLEAGREASARMAPAEAAQVDARASAKFGPMLAELQAMAKGEAAPAPEPVARPAKKPKAAKA